MPILPGRRLGPYEILSAIGAGGMGEVYKARDTRLDRIVAIKVLPAHLADRSELRERFEREAKTIASLNHPHICVLHDIGHQDGIDFLVMEYLEGETLAQRLVKGPLPIDLVLQYAIEITDALDKAHRKGITHRDLKPGNVMLTKSGTKLLDFGLAKLKQEVAPVSVPLSQLPTANNPLTAHGTIVGTLQYMAPEQLEGTEVDARTDIFAFGAVTYEMATGKRAFEGKSQASLMVAIMEREPPPMSSLQPMMPPSLDRAVKRCLAKDPENRWQTARDLELELKSITEGAEQAESPTVISSRRGIFREVRMAWTVAAIAVIAAIALAFVHFRVPGEDATLVKMSVLPLEKAVFNPRSIPAISPDGRRLAFVAALQGKTQLWVRDLDSLAARPLPGTDGADHPFWSPDGRFIAFYASGKLKKIEVAGGPALSLCDAAAGGTGYGGSWSNHDVLLFSPTNSIGLFGISAAGGNIMPVTTPDQESGETSHRLPWFLPDGHHFLYTSLNANQEKTGVYVADLDSKTRHQVLSGSTNAIYVSPGYLLFVRERTLMAQRFDAAKLQTIGDPFPLAEGVDASSVAAQSQFSSSQNGILAYTSGIYDASGRSQLTWFDRSGKVLGTVGTPGAMHKPSISPDGSTVAIDRFDAQTNSWDIWLHDIVRGTASRFTFNSKSSEYPQWSPDGSHIAFYSFRDGPSNVYQKATSGAAQDEALDKSALNKLTQDWSRDGRYIVEVVTNAPKTGYDIWVLPMFGNRKPFPYLQTEFNEYSPKFSPDGHWLAYTSNETKRDEVYVQTFPKPQGKWQISTDGGSRPVWRQDGKELFFIGGRTSTTTGVGPEQKMMVTEIKTDAAGGKFQASVPKALFDTRMPPATSVFFDVSKDGRFLMPVQAEEQLGGVPVTVVVNWTAGLKK